MQSSDMTAYNDARAELERETIAQDQGAWVSDVLDAFDAGYRHAHGIACHNVPEVGATVWTDSDGRVEVDADNVREVHASICFEAESNARCYSPWEHIAHDLNTRAPDGEEWLTELLWAAYDHGVAQAIEHDLKGYDYD